MVFRCLLLSASLLSATLLPALVVLEVAAPCARAQVPKTGAPDAGKPDAGKPDAGKPDAGKPDAGKPHARAQAPDANAEARVFFEQGNREVERARRLRGAKRTERLERALGAYLSSLRLVRSRNALFNTASVLEELERLDEAFAYYQEYLQIEDLDDTERQTCEERVTALTKRVAMVVVHSAPAGAEVFVDRLDLAPRGKTPLALALPEGERRIVIRLAAYEDFEVRAKAVLGRRELLIAKLEPSPRALRLTGFAEGRYLIDGEQVEGDTTVEVGSHRIRFEPKDADPIERAVEVEPSAQPLAVHFEAPTHARWRIRSEVAAEVFLDGKSVGEGQLVEGEASPGRHALRVEAQKRLPIDRELELHAGRTTEVDVSLSPASKGRTLGKVPAWFALGTIGAGIVTTALAINALRQFEYYNDYIDQFCRPNGCPGDELGLELATRQRRANIAADIALGTTAALGLTTLILFLLDRPIPGDPSEATISLMPFSSGFGLGARGQL